MEDQVLQVSRMPTPEELQCVAPPMASPASSCVAPSPGANGTTWTAAQPFVGQYDSGPSISSLGNADAARDQAYTREQLEAQEQLQEYLRINQERRMNNHIHVPEGEEAAP